MADERQTLRPTCIPSSSREVVYPSPAAAERRSWPENPAADPAASITAASSPGASMLSAISDSRASSPAGTPVQAGTHGGRDVEVLLWQQRQHHQQAMEATATGPVTPTAEMVQSLYWQSLQQQQHSAQHTPKGTPYPPGPSAGTLPAQLLHQWQQQVPQQQDDSNSAQHLWRPPLTAGQGANPAVAGNQSSGLLPAGPDLQRPARTMNLSALPPLASGSSAQASAQHAIPHLASVQVSTMQDHNPQPPRHVQTALASVPQPPDPLKDQKPSSAVQTEHSPASSHVGGSCSSRSPVQAAAGLPGTEGGLHAAAAADVYAAAAGEAVGHTDMPTGQHGPNSSTDGWQQLMLRMLAAAQRAGMEPDTGAGPADATTMHSALHRSAASAAEGRHEQAGAAHMIMHHLQQGSGTVHVPTQAGPHGSSGQCYGLAGNTTAGACSQLGGQSAGVSFPAVPAELPPSIHAAAADGPARLHSVRQLQPQQGHGIQGHGLPVTHRVPQQAVMASGNSSGQGHAQHEMLQQGPSYCLYGPSAAPNSHQSTTHSPGSAPAPAAPQPPSMHDAGGTSPYDSRRGSAHDAAAAAFYALAAAAAQLHASPGAVLPNLSAVERAAGVAQQHLFQAVGAPSSALHRELTLNPAAAGGSTLLGAAGPAAAARPAEAVLPPSAVLPSGQVLQAAPPGPGAILQAVHEVAQVAHADLTSRAGAPLHPASAVAYTGVPLGAGHLHHHHARAQGPAAAEAICYGTCEHSTTLGAAGRNLVDTREYGPPGAFVAAGPMAPPRLAPQQQRGSNSSTVQQESHALGCAGPVAYQAHAPPTVLHSVGADGRAGWSSPFAAAANTCMPGAALAAAASMHTQQSQQHGAAAAAVAAARSSALHPQNTGPYLPGTLSGSALTLQQQQVLLLQQQQEQVDQVMRLQQLQLLQWQLVGAAGVAAGGPLAHHAAYQAAALHAPPLLGMWGMSACPGGMYPLLQHMQQQQQGLAALWQGQPVPPTQHVLPAVAPQAADSLLQAVAPPVQPGVECSGDTAADAISDMSRASNGHASAGPGRQFSRSASITSWLPRWMPLPSHRHSHAAAAQQLPAAPATSWLGPDTAAAADGSRGAGMSVAAVAAAPGLATDTWMLQAAFPVAGPALAAVVGASSLVLQGWCFMGRTAASASAWAALTLALTFVKISQYQLLLFLCYLTLLAAAGEAARSAVFATAGAGRFIVRLVDREARLFARAAAVVAFTDIKQLCMLLATQPFLLLHSGPAHRQQATASTAAGEAAAAEAGAAPAAEAAMPGRTFSRSLSQVLGSLLHRPQHSLVATPRSSANSSRRTSIHAAEAGSCRSTLCSTQDAWPVASDGSAWRTSQEVAIRPSPAACTVAPAGQAAAAGRHGTSKSDITAGLSRHILVVYDSLAIVSGLWTGLFLRIWMLLALQAPLASCRIWVHAVSTGCWMSTAAAVASTRTALQAAWTLAHFSVVLLGAASSAGPSMVKLAAAGVVPSDSTAAPATQAAEQGLSGGASTLPGPVGAGAQAAAQSVLRWWWVNVWRPCCSLAWRVFAAASWAVPGSNALQAATTGHGAWAVNTGKAIVAGVSSLLLWLTTLRSQAGGLLSTAGLRAVVVKAAQLSGWLLVWVASLGLGFTERLTVLIADWLLKDLPPLARVGVFGSARMIKGLVVEAGQQSAMLAGQLLAAWQMHGVV